MPFTRICSDNYEFSMHICLDDFQILDGGKKNIDSSKFIGHIVTAHFLCRLLLII